MQKIQHRDVTFEYSEEAEQDANAQYGIDLSRMGRAGIDILLEQGVAVKQIGVEITREDNRIVIEFSPKTD